MRWEIRRQERMESLNCQQGAAPKRGPATAVGNSGVREGPPSVIVGRIVHEYQ